MENVTFQKKIIWQIFSFLIRKFKLKRTVLKLLRQKKKPLLGAGKWIRGESFETNYKWDAQKGISYHAFKTFEFKLEALLNVFKACDLPAHQA